MPILVISNPGKSLLLDGQIQHLETRDRDTSLTQ